MINKNDYKKFELSRKPTTSFRLEKVTLDNLEIAADRFCVTKSVIIKKLINDFLKDPERFGFTPYK